MADKILNRAAMRYVYNGWELLDKGMDKEALKIYPDCVDALNIYGSVYLDRFQFRNAERVYAEALGKAIQQQGGKENPFIVKMLISYLENFFVSKLGRKFYGNLVEIFQSPYCRYLLQTVWNENELSKMGYLTYHWFINAYEFCKLYGPLWIKHEGIYEILKEVENATS